MLAAQLSPFARGRAGTAPVGRTVAWVALAYGTLGAFGAIAALALGNDPLTTEPWLPVDGAFAACLSLGLGLGVAVATIAATRAMVARFSWARQLHGDLRPVVQGADNTMILMTAIASGVGEEIFFRGLLVPWLGVWISSLAFGLLHQVRGRARWAWAAWAAIMGVLFALLFVLTGHLEGAILAHVVINTANLRFLRDHMGPAPKARALGGLLGR